MRFSFISRECSVSLAALPTPRCANSYAIALHYGISIIHPGELSQQICTNTERSSYAAQPTHAAPATSWALDLMYATAPSILSFPMTPAPPLPRLPSSDDGARTCLRLKGRRNQSPDRHGWASCHWLYPDPACFRLTMIACTNARSFLQPHGLTHTSFLQPQGFLYNRILSLLFLLLRLEAARAGAREICSPHAPHRGLFRSSFLASPDRLLSPLSLLCTNPAPAKTKFESHGEAIRDDSVSRECGKDSDRLGLGIQA